MSMQKLSISNLVYILYTELNFYILIEINFALHIFSKIAQIRSKKKIKKHNFLNKYLFF
jgi:hypothetical protein